MTDVISKDNTFPAAPYHHDICFRPDLGYWCQYDGARWVGEQYEINIAQVTDTDSTDHEFHWVGDSDAIIADYFAVRTYVSTTNDSDNYWRVLIRSRDLANSTPEPVVFLGTSADAADTYYSHSTPKLWNKQIPSIYGIMYFRAAKVGSPGDLTFSGTFRYRRVYT